MTIDRSLVAIAVPDPTDAVDEQQHRSRLATETIDSFVAVVGQCPV